MFTRIILSKITSDGSTVHSTVSDPPGASVSVSLALRGILVWLISTETTGLISSLVELIMFAPTAADSTGDRKSTRLNSSHGYISYAVFCLKKKISIDSQ